ncbi:LamG-like jellyroll fold domain-containing protein, partial [Vibrio parahaemolyticus]
MVSATTGATQNDWGIGLNSSGKIVFGTGNADTTITAAAASNNGAWHHVVCTRVKSTGAMVLYIDGASSATGTGGTNTLSTPTTIWLARQA